MNTENCDREYDFALVIEGVSKLTTDVEDALFEAGCDDATLSIQYGHLYADFSRSAPSLKDAILSAIRDIGRANVGAKVLRVDECQLVTQSEIARKIGRSRQLVNQYISGKRGPGNFPAPEFHLVEGEPLWAWCAVSRWLAENSIIRPEEGWNAQVVAIINNRLEEMAYQKREPELVREIESSIASA